MAGYERALGALLILGGVLVGLPLVLAAMGNPLEEWSALKVGDISDAVVISLLAAVTWSAWALFALQIVVEAFSVILRLPSPTLPGLVPGQQQVARALVAAAAVLLPAVAPAHALASQIPPALTSTSAPAHMHSSTPPPTPGQTTATPAADSRAAPATSATPAAASPTPTVTTSVPARSYRVGADGPGTYWDLAATMLGDPHRWREIWDLNGGRRQLDGTLMTSPGLLRPGWTVLIPGTTPAASGPAGPSSRFPTATSTPSTEPAATRLVYVVAEGDWLGAVAERFLGRFGRFSEITITSDPASARVRTSRPGGDHIEPRWRLQLPADARERGPRQHATGSLVVPAVLTPPNRHRMGGPDPQRLSPAPTPTGDQATGQPQRPTPSSAATARSANTAQPAVTAASPTRSPTQPSEPDALTQPERTDRPAAGTAHQPGSHPDGVNLTDGWLSIPLATALLALAAAAWRQRRRHYRYPDPPDPYADLELNQLETAPPHSDDGIDLDDDLRPMPPVLTHIRRAVRAHATQLALDDPANPHIAPTSTPWQPADLPNASSTPTGAEPSPSLKAEPEQRPREQPTVDDTTVHVWVPSPFTALPPRASPDGRGPADQNPSVLGGLLAVSPDGTGLDGPGAFAAARALLLAALTNDRPDRAPTTQVITTGSTLTTLLDGQGSDTHVIPGVKVAATIDEALALLDEHVLERHRRLLERATDPQSAPNGSGPPGSTFPALLLLLAPPWDAALVHLITSTRLAAPLDIHTVILGHWTPGQTLTIDTRGHATGSHPSAATDRIDVLDIPNTLQLLTLLTETRPSIEAFATTATQAPGPVEAPPALSPSPPTALRIAAAGPETQFDPAVQVRLFGPPTVIDRHGTAVPAMRQHATQLLVYLAVHRDGARLSDIMEVLWPDATLRRASERLATEVANLRRTIRRAADDPNAQAVINTGGHYHLNPDVLDLDVWRLQDHLREAFATTDTSTRTRLLRAAVAAHPSGVLADGRDYDWVDPYREQLRRRGIQARLALADLVGAQDPTEAALITVQAADLDPYNEDTTQRAMRALAAAGDLSAVGERLRLLRTALNEIEAAPTQQTLTLAAQLGAHQAGTGQEPQP